MVGLHGNHVLRLAELLLLLDLSNHLVHGVVWSELILLRVFHQVLHEEDGFRYLKVLHNSGRNSVFVDRGGWEVFELKSALCLLHRLLSRSLSMHLGTFVHKGRALGDDTRKFRSRDELFGFRYLELERLELVHAGGERGRQLALPDQLGVVRKPEDVASTCAGHPVSIVRGRYFSHTLKLELYVLHTTIKPRPVVSC